jgi:energy-coupling factor transporter ATP-binding protein EcfA2
MLTKLIIRNFKRFGEVEVDLAKSVVFIGPNNAGKTTALQALALWNIGLKRWNEKRKGTTTPEQRPGVTINRRDLTAMPVPGANLLWRNLRVRGSQPTPNIRIDIIVEGVMGGESWECGFEFDYANPESFYCRPLRLTEGKAPERMPVPEAAGGVEVAFLPPMSGLTANETRLDAGAINVRIGEGRTAEVLRNLCYQIFTEDEAKWSSICRQIEDLFGEKLDAPTYIAERGEVALSYHTPAGVQLDLSTTGRGLQQTLLLLAYMAANPHAVLLLDEPDAHLEILRQRQIYRVLSETAHEQGSQFIAASHSEIILEEAAQRDTVVAFVGKPHRIDDRGSQLLKSLRQIGFDQYYQAEQRGWVLYLEGSTDLAILQAFAKTLNHPAQEALARPFVHYVEDQPQKARDHFHGLREAKPDLVGLAIFDRLERQLSPQPELKQCMWQRREIENYLCQEQVLLAWAKSEREEAFGPLFATTWETLMRETIVAITQAMETLGKGSPWSPDTKVTDDFLDPLFKSFYKTLNLPNQMRKTNYHVLARFVPADLIDPEVTQVLDLMVEMAAQAAPLEEDGEAIP